MMRSLVVGLQGWGIRVCGVYLIDALFMEDTSKFVSGTLTALSTMVQLELPHINVITKCDLLEKRTTTEKGGANTEESQSCKEGTSNVGEYAEDYYDISTALNGRIKPKFLIPDGRQLADELSLEMNPRYRGLNEGVRCVRQLPSVFACTSVSLSACICLGLSMSDLCTVFVSYNNFIPPQAICSLLEDYRMVSFVPLDSTSEDSIQFILSQIDNAIQYGDSYFVLNSESVR